MALDISFGGSILGDYHIASQTGGGDLGSRSSMTGMFTPKDWVDEDIDPARQVAFDQQVTDAFLPHQGQPPEVENVHTRATHSGPDQSSEDCPSAATGLD